jgi:Mrp family chromosome partitioning ATPase
VVLVVKAGETRRDAVRSAIQQLESAGAKLLGTVFNQQEDRIPDAIYKRL